MNWLETLKLKKEANLLDSKLFIAKTFLAITTAYWITSHIEFVSRDMISVLFGLVLTLEPINSMGLKNGWDQLFASFVGAVATSLLIMIFGVNAITIGASVAITLYLTLLLNWKNVSVVALFTAIYMTQYLQAGPDGDPSVWITFQLRFAALSSGIAVALVYNYIFSLIQYRIISQKRLIYLFKRLLSNMAETQVALETCEPEDFQKVRMSLMETSNSIEWVANMFGSLKKEAAGNKIRSTVRISVVEKSIEVTSHMRNIGHLLFDITYVLGEEKVKQEDLKEISEDLSQYFTAIMDHMGAIKVTYEKKSPFDATGQESLKFRQAPIQNEYAARIERDLRDIQKSLKHIGAISFLA